MGRLINGIGKSFLTVLVLLLIVYGWAFFEIKIMLKSYPELFGYVFYHQKVDDMSPEINSEDIVIVKKNDEYKKGDVVLYLNEKNKYSLSTVVNKDNFTTTTRCKTCSIDEEPIDKSTVVGRAVGKISSFGNIVNFFKQKWFLITIAVFGFVLVVVSQYMLDKPKQIS